MTTDQPRSMSAASVTRAVAVALIDVARTAAADIGVEMAIAVMDAAGHLKAFESMDHTPFLANDVAVDKAWTAASYRRTTHVWNAYIQDPAVAQLAHRPRVVAVGGGYPIIDDGEVIGGLGLSGGTVEQDRRAAETALTSLGFDIPA